MNLKNKDYDSNRYTSIIELIDLSKNENCNIIQNMFSFLIKYKLLI